MLIYKIKILLFIYCLEGINLNHEETKLKKTINY